jgi:extracellular matrix regulatory protein B
VYLHLGGDVVIPLMDIVGIFDIDSTTTAGITRGFLSSAQDSGFVKTVSYDLPKSFVLIQSKKDTSVYLSPISSVTLLKRAGFLKDFE